MISTKQIRSITGAGLIALVLLTGCKNKEQQALDQAKAQAASTNTPQKVSYIDANGNAVTTTVQPPVAGQAQLIATSITPPPPGPKPNRTDPVVAPLTAPSANDQSDQSAQSGAGSQTPDTGNGAMQPQNNGAMQAQNGAMQQQNTGPQQNATGPNQPAAPLQLTVPAGTELAIRINQHISVKTSRVGDRFSGEVVEPVVLNGTVVIPHNTPVSGRVDASHRRGHFRGRSILELRLTEMTLNGNQYALDTHDSVRTKKGKGKRTAGFIGGMTGAGMLIGGIATGGVGLAIGGAAGAGAGTLLAGATGNRDISIPAESIVHFRLADQLVVQNP
jgi:hypothetical protein